MSHPEPGPRDLAAAYALGSLTQEEAREFEAFLATSAEARREVAEYREVASLLGLVGSEAAAPPDLRTRVLARVTEPRHGQVRRIGVSRLALGALAASLVAALGLGAGVLWLRGEVADRDAVIAERDRDIATQTHAVTERQAILDAILDPSVRLYQLTSSGNPDPGIQLFWNLRRNQALLNAYRLQSVPQGRVYQLWFIRNGKPVPSVTFTPKANGSATIGQVRVPADGAVTAAALTVEPAGGSKQPTSPILLVGPLKRS